MNELKKKQIIVKVSDAIPLVDGFSFTEPINFTLQENQHWAVMGPNGSGKTIFANILTQRLRLKQGSIVINTENAQSNLLSDHIKLVTFHDIYSLADLRFSYYQQRWNHGDELNVPTVQEILNQSEKEITSSFIQWFEAEHLQSKPVNLLSSGELRKVLLIRALLSQPRILIIDHPFIGLDAASRKILTQTLHQISLHEKTQIVLLLSDPYDIPEMITHILPIRHGRVFPSSTKDKFLTNVSKSVKLFEGKKKTIIPLDFSKTRNNTFPFFEFAFQLNRISIEYNQQIILDNISWEAKKGEKWALLGPNGSGKSTLISLIMGDNPQAYAQDIYLFDRKRGSGESIWDIKKRIGYVSSEMHLFYTEDIDTIAIVCSGFYDTIGLYQKFTLKEEALALAWMDCFGIKQLAKRRFLKLSFGEQRLALLARAFVKNPDLLILDEPMHGLDVSWKENVKSIINSFCDTSKTLIYVTHYEEEIPACIDHYFHLAK